MSLLPQGLGGLVIGWQGKLAALGVASALAFGSGWQARDHFCDAAEVRAEASRLAAERDQLTGYIAAQDEAVKRAERAEVAAMDALRTERRRIDAALREARSYDPPVPTECADVVLAGPDGMRARQATLDAAAGQSRQAADDLD
jgi:hypothetical protein